MKSLTAWVLAGALLVLAAPIAAQAHEWRDYGVRQPYDNGWRQRDIVRDRHDIRGDWRDVNHDRWELRQDIAHRNWLAASAERADIRRDLGDIHRDRWDLHRDHFVPGRTFATVPAYGYPRVQSGYYRPYLQ
jgi:hypothetical protein